MYFSCLVFFVFLTWLFLEQMMVFVAVQMDNLSIPLQLKIFALPVMLLQFLAPVLGIGLVLGWIAFLAVHKLVLLRIIVLESSFVLLECGVLVLKAILLVAVNIIAAKVSFVLFRWVNAWINVQLALVLKADLIAMLVMRCARAPLDVIQVRKLN